MTRPDAKRHAIQTAGSGLDGTVEQLARMLAAVDFEHAEDVRVFGCSPAVPDHYAQLREAARNVVEEARRGA